MTFEIPYSKDLLILQNTLTCKLSFDSLGNGLVALEQKVI